MPPTERKDINLRSNCRRWETKGICPHHATRFYGSKVILRFRLLSKGLPSFHVLCHGILHSPLTVAHAGGPVPKPRDGDRCGEVVVGVEGTCCSELRALAWSQADLTPLTVLML